MTGRYPMRAGVHDTVAGVSILSTGETTLADILSANGYATAIFGKWHLGMSYPYLPQHRGFQETFIHGGGGIGSWGLGGHGSEAEPNRGREAP